MTSDKSAVLKGVTANHHHARYRRQIHNEGRTMANNSTNFREAVARATALIKQCISEHGFLASPTDSDNYRSIWGRDGIIIGLAALMTGDNDMVSGLKKTLKGSTSPMP